MRKVMMIEHEKHIERRFQRHRGFVRATPSGVFDTSSALHAEPGNAASKRMLRLYLLNVKGRSHTSLSSSVFHSHFHLVGRDSAEDVRVLVSIFIGLISHMKPFPCRRF